MLSTESRRRIFLRGLSAFLACLRLTPVRAQRGVKPLVLGIVPNLSPRSMLTVYQPLRAQLETFLARPVMLFTAPDFHTFYQRTLDGEYDIALMPAHLARLAQIEGGLMPFAKFLPAQFGLVAVRNNSVLHMAADLRGKRIALVDRIALVTLRGEDWLQAQGVAIDSHALTPMHFTYHNAAVEAVLNGRADAAIVSSGPFNTMPKDLREAARILASLGDMPANVFVAHPRLRLAEVEELRSVLFDYARRPGKLKGFLERYRYENIAPVEPDELYAMDRYAKRAKQIMKESGRNVSSRLGLIP